jgi:putative endopeptidase
MNRRFFLSAGASVVTVALAACASKDVETVLAEPAPIPPPGPKAQIGDFGLDLAAGDPSVAAGDNFYQHCSGAWLKNNPIPADRTRWGTFDMLGAKSEENIRAIIDELSAKDAPAGSIERKIGDYYRAYMNEAAIEAAGLAPIQGDLARLAGARTHADLVRVAAEPTFNTRLPIVAFIGLDQKNPDKYIVSITHAGLGLPEREYYLNADAKFADIRAKYIAHIEKTLTLAGQTNGAAKARRIVALETEIAKLHWPVADRRDRNRTYNRKTKAELVALLNGFPVQAALESLKLTDQTEFVVRELDALPKLATLFRTTPLATWKEYTTFACISGNASLLPKALADERFDFYGRILNGQPQERDRWKRGVDAVSGAMGEALGQVYVQRHFPADAKTKMLDLVENMRKAYAQRIETLPWMTAASKIVAREKLAAFRVKIGYPDKWRDYSALEVTPDNPIENGKRATLFDYNRRVARINGPTDRDEWSMTPQTVNAYYNPVFNEIVFPAAILQPPFFDPNADPAVNYGGIGGVIGHEMGHGFDDQGAKSDARGVLRDWWNAEDVAAFKTLTDRLAGQYSEFEALPA